MGMGIRKTLLVFFLITGTAFAQSGIGGHSGGLGTPPPRAQEEGSTHSRTFTKLIFDTGAVSYNGSHVHVTTSATSPALVDTYVPYTGADKSVNLNDQHLLVGTTEIDGSLDAYGNISANFGGSYVRMYHDGTSANLSANGGNISILAPGAADINLRFGGGVANKLSIQNATTEVASVDIYGNAIFDGSVTCGPLYSDHQHPLYVPYVDFSTNQHFEAETIGVQHLLVGTAEVDGSTSMYGNLGMNWNDISQVDVITANDLVGAYLYSTITGIGIDMTGDPWYFSESFDLGSNSITCGPLYSDHQHSAYVTLEQVPPQHLTASPTIDTLTSGYLPYANVTKQLVNSGLYWDGTKLGIGTTSPGYKLDVNGTAQITHLQLGSYGVASGPALYWAGDTLTGLFRPDVGKIAFDCNGTECMRIDNGNVGIGTNAPTYKLAINGAAGSTSGLQITNLGTATYGIDLTSSGLSGNADYFFYADASNWWRADNVILTNGVRANNFADTDGVNHITFGITVDDTWNPSAGKNINLMSTGAGNVGIGTVTPSYKLDVNGDLRCMNLYSTHQHSSYMPYGSYADASHTHAEATAGAAGFVEALSGIATEYYDGSGSWSTPASGGATSHNHPLYIPYADYPTNQHLEIHTIGSQHTITKALEVDGQSYFANNVGIGTTSPLAALNVVNRVVIGNAGIDVDSGATLSVSGYIYSNNSIYSAKSNDVSAFRARNPGTTTRGTSIVFDARNSGSTYQSSFISWDPDNLKMFFGDTTTLGTPLLSGDVTFDLNSGNVGIGTVTPSYKLDVNGDLRCMNLYSTHQHNLSYPSTTQFQSLYSIATTNTHSVATTSATGFAPILSNVATEFLNGTGAYSVPSSGSGVDSFETLASPQGLQGIEQLRHNVASYQNYGNVICDGLQDQTGISGTHQVTYTGSSSYQYAIIGATASSQYPPTQNDTYVKATSHLGGTYEAWFATDPTEPLTGTQVSNQWLTNTAIINQRFHIDLGSAIIINRIYYENSHDSGLDTDQGIKNFTFQGSNTAGDFADLTYANNGTWVNLTTSPTQMVEHVAANQADPKYITVTNTTAYRYYALKFADQWGDASFMGIRRVELQYLPSYTSGFLHTIAYPLPTVPTHLGVSVKMDSAFTSNQHQYLKVDISRDGGTTFTDCHPITKVGTHGYYRANMETITAQPSGSNALAKITLAGSTTKALKGYSIYGE